MTITLEGRVDFTLDVARRVAWEGENVIIGSCALEAMDEARNGFLALLENDHDQFIYGTTTTTGMGARGRLTPEEQKAYAQRRPGNARTTFGDPLPERVVRAIVLCRLTNFIEGHSKVRPIVAQRVASMLDGRPLPAIPSRGSAFSGEIQIPLRLFFDLFGDLEPGESTGVNSGACVSPALGLDALWRAEKRLRLAEHVFGLSIEGFNAPLEPYDSVLKALWVDAHDAAALDALALLLSNADTVGRRSYQAPVTWRVIPRLLGMCHRAVASLRHAADVSLRDVTDSPVYIPPDKTSEFGRAFSTGGFHNAIVCPAIDGVARCWAELCGLADHQSTKFLKSEISDLPSDLVKESGSRFRLDMVQVQWGEEARALATNTFIPMSDGGGHAQTDTPSPTMIAYRKEVQVAECLDACLAILAVIASQALWVTDRQPAPALRPFLKQIRTHVPPIEHGRDIGADCEQLWRAFSSAAVSSDPAVLVGE